MIRNLLAGGGGIRRLVTEWADDLGDTRQDIYTLEDGLPPDASRGGANIGFFDVCEFA